MRYEEIEIAREWLRSTEYCFHHRATARKYQYRCGIYLIMDYKGRYGTGKKLVYSLGADAKYLLVEYWLREEA